MYKEYKNLNRQSNIMAYKILDNAIEVVFSNKNNQDTYYLYTYESTGIEAVEKMKKFAILGKGLGAMLATKPYHRYEKKW